MTHFELYNTIKEMDESEEIKKVVKKAVLEELAGDDFTIKESKKATTKATGDADIKKKISNEVFKRKNALEKENGRKITDAEKETIRKEVEQELQK